MTQRPQDVSALRRPRLLVQAARIGAEALLRKGRPGPRRALDRLLDEESELERKRKDGEAGYSPRRHVDLLIALMLAAQTTQVV